MIRSQIPLSLPPMHRESGSALARGGRPAVVNGPAVGVHLGRGGVREWITGVCDYRMPTPAFPYFSRDGRRSFCWIAFVPPLLRKIS